MMVNLKKGNVISIEQNKLRVCIHSEEKGNINLSAFMLNIERVVPSEDYFVFYGTRIFEGKRISHDESLIYNKTAKENYITIDLGLVRNEVKEIIFVGLSKNVEQGSSSILSSGSSFIISDYVSGEELVRCYPISPDPGTTAIEYARFYRSDDNWKFQSLGICYREGFDFFLAKYYKGESVLRKYNLSDI